MVKAMQKEIQAYASPQKRRVSTIFLGGGTPSSLSPAALSRLLTTVFEVFDVHPKSEKTSEMNPESTSKSKLDVLRAFGFNRLSFGVQSFIPHELKFLGRSHSPERVKRAVELAKDAGFSNINIDLIFGLPHSTLEDVQFNVEKALELSPTHISTYALTIEDKTPFKKRRIKPVDSDIELQQYQLIQRYLKTQGFNHYEVSAFAQPGFRCKHNLAYWNLTPFIGIGPNASSFWEDKHSTNTASLEDYMANPYPALLKKRKPLPQADIIRDYMVANLRRLDGISFKKAFSRLGVRLDEQFKDTIKPLVHDGFVTHSKHRLKVTKKGLAILDSVLEKFV
jgi:oxygen-independent coproporphyrinogen-3 oxidase